MNLTIVSVGDKMPGWVDTGCKEYLKRFGRDCTVKLVEVPLGARGKNADIDRAMTRESAAMLKHIQPGSLVIALTVDGKSWDTQGLAAHMENWKMNGESVCFLIGGPDGLHADCIDQASIKMSLSGFTLPHTLARLTLIEQLYRAWSILANHPYHR
jgi:23S rRNA (pseudouridine1915-N3)-methyltransferase